MYVLMALLSLVIFAWTTKVWRADLTVPLHYSGDALYYGTLIKTYLDNESFFDNKFLGAPGGLNWRDYPETLDNLNLFLIKIIALFSKQWPVVLNLFYISTYPLIGITSLYALRQMKVKTETAFVAGLLFTFAPYHFARGENHLFLSAYYAIPLAILLCYRIYRDENWKRISSIISCLIIASTGPYYAFFGIFFILLSGIYASIGKRRWRELILAGVFSGFILVVGTVNLAPNILYSYKNGLNNYFVKRKLGETEIYGLKIVQMLLPIGYHRISWLSDLRFSYNKESFLVNENGASSLGVIGSVAFIVLIATKIFRFRLKMLRNKTATDQFSLWGSLTIGGVLLGTVGGGGSLISILGLSQIRSYNRISIYIAFLSLLAGGYVFDFIFPNKIKYKILRYTLLFLIAVFGILDQTIGLTPRYDLITEKFNQEQVYFDRVGSVVKNGRPVLQLPYTAFPENPMVNGMENYENIKPYLHTNSIRWSYGAMTDRYFDLWQRELSNLPTPKLVEMAKKAGFGGILINTAGYAGDGIVLEKKLSELLQIESLRDERGRFSFFYFGDMVDKSAPTYPVLTRWVEGCYPIEFSKDGNWRWCKRRATLVVINPDNRKREIKIEMGLASGKVMLSKLKIRGLINKDMEINGRGSRFDEVVEVPPGYHLIDLTSGAAPINNSLDERWLVFRVIDYKATDLTY